MLLFVIFICGCQSTDNRSGNGVFVHKMVRELCKKKKYSSYHTLFEAKQSFNLEKLVEEKVTNVSTIYPFLKSFCNFFVIKQRKMSLSLLIKFFQEMSTENYENITYSNIRRFFVNISNFNMKAFGKAQITDLIVDCLDGQYET